LNSKIYELKELDQIAQWIIDFAQNEKLWVFQGDMGAGKTTLIKALGEKFGVASQVSSPTFGIVNHYELSGKAPIYHFDFYRLEKPEEALDIGVEEYFESGNYCWMEWAEKLGGFIPDHFLLIKIEYNSTSSRNITLQHYRDVDSD